MIYMDGVQSFIVPRDSTHLSALEQSSLHTDERSPLLKWFKSTIGNNRFAELPRVILNGQEPPESLQCHRLIHLAFQQEFFANTPPSIIYGKTLSNAAFVAIKVLNKIQHKECILVLSEKRSHLDQSLNFYVTDVHFNPNRFDHSTTRMDQRLQQRIIRFLKGEPSESLVIPNLFANAKL